MVSLNRKRFPKKLKKKMVVAVVKKAPRKTLYKSRQFPLPQSKIVKLRYVEQITIDSGLGTIGSYAFNCTGLFKPNQVAAGHQPYGFDQIMAMYNHYQVLGARIKVSVATSQIADAHFIAIKVDDNTALTSTNPWLLLEQPNLKRKLVSNTNQSTILSASFSAQKFWKLKNLSGQYNSELVGDLASNPVDSAFFNILIGPYTTTQDLASLPCIVEIEYIAKFFEPKDLASS